MSKALKIWILTGVLAVCAPVVVQAQWADEDLEAFESDNWAFDDYGYYDEDYVWQADDEDWYADWYGDDYTDWYAYDDYAYEEDEWFDWI